MNLAIISGNLGAEPELRRTPSGTAVLNLRLCTNERIKKGDDWTDHAEWHSVVLFGKRAESLAGMLTKGSQVIVRGALRTTSWEKDGVKKYKTEISADDVELCGRKGDGAPRVEAPSRYGTTGHGASAKHATTPEPMDLDGTLGTDDDIPF